MYNDRVYLAGPMRGIKYFNFPEFDRLEKIISEIFTVISPAALDRAAGFDPKTLPENTNWNEIPHGFDFKACMNRDIQAILSCDAIVLMSGWENSKGACAEKALAEWAGLRVYYVDGNGIISTEPIKTVSSTVRTFSTGATRSQDDTRDDPEGYLSPLVIDRFSQYMTKHRIQPDGSIRGADNWQKGMPLETYMKGAWRHMLHWWTRHRGCKVRDPKAAENIEEDLCALMFNVMGYLHEKLKDSNKAN